jgi:hypothetical protein
MLVTWFGTGAIALPAGQDWKAEMLTVYDSRLGHESADNDSICKDSGALAKGA